MKAKLDLTKVLLGCPNMELDCAMYSNLWFDKLQNAEIDSTYPICCYTVADTGEMISEVFTKYGTHSYDVNSRCVIFPKGKTSWDGFMPDVKFNDGDIVTYGIGDEFIGSAILAGEIIKSNALLQFDCHCSWRPSGALKPHKHSITVNWMRPATEDEIREFHEMLRDNDYRWEAESKSLIDLPTEFVINDGDILVGENSTSGFKWIGKIKGDYRIKAYDYVIIDEYFSLDEAGSLTILDHMSGTLLVDMHIRLASEDEKNRLFRALEDRDYRWDSESKSLMGMQTLREFTIYDGNIIACKNLTTGHEWISMVKGQYFIMPGKSMMINEYCSISDSDNWEVFNCRPGVIDKELQVRLANREEMDRLFKAIIDHGYRWDDRNGKLLLVDKLKFKVGDIIKFNSTKDTYTITNISINSYILNDGGSIRFDDECYYKLAPKFDPNTFEPFERVLTRYNEDCKWKCDSYSHIITDPSSDKIHCQCSGGLYSMCIPYKGNEHLRGNYDDCDDFYKYWED